MDADGTITVVRGRCSPRAADYPTIRPHRLADRLLQPRGDGKLVRDHRVELDVDGERTEVAELVG